MLLCTERAKRLFLPLCITLDDLIELSAVSAITNIVFIDRSRKDGEITLFLIFVALFATLCTNAIRLLDDKGYVFGYQHVMLSFSLRYVFVIVFFSEFVTGLGLYTLVKT